MRTSAQVPKHRKTRGVPRVLWDDARSLMPEPGTIKYLSLALAWLTACIWGATFYGPLFSEDWAGAMIVALAFITPLTLGSLFTLVAGAYSAYMYFEGVLERARKEAP